MAPRTWIILGDKKGDNGQVEAIVDALDWPVEKKIVQMRPEFVIGKPRHRPSLDHIDPSKSDPLEAPWPDLIITIGRRPSMVALWVRKQSGNKTRVVLVGKPTGHLQVFSLVIASAENQLPPLPNFMPLTLPLMRINPSDVASEMERWESRLGSLKKPLVAVMVGGETNPFSMNRKVARELVKTAQWIVDQVKGTPYFTTSRRTSPEVIEVLREELPEQAKLFEWSSAASENPYRALLGSADAFVVTADSVSMMTEVIYLHKPLAIFPLPAAGWLGKADLYRRSLAHWLFLPRRESKLDRCRHGVARIVYYLDVFKLLCSTRDFRAFHSMLVEKGYAVWCGQPFIQPASAPPNDLDAVVTRIKNLS